MTATGLAILFSRLNRLWPNQPALEPEMELTIEWSNALKGATDDEIFEAVPRLAQTLERRPSIAELLQAARGVRAGAPTTPALPEPRSPVPDHVVNLVEAILQRKHQQRMEAPELRVVGREYRPSKPLQVERTEPLDALQRWLQRHYTKGMTLTCAVCNVEVREGQFYQITPADDFVHAGCAAKVGATA